MSYHRLPANAIAARQFLVNAIDQNDLTIVLIIGDDKTAVEAQNYSAVLAKHSDFRSVAFIEVRNVGVIMPILEKLPDPRVSLEDLEDFVALSISPRKNILASRVSKAQFNKGKGWIKTAVLRAMAIG